jgi:Fe2+ or Zn2+ uptake regulation protein
MAGLELALDKLRDAGYKITHARLSVLQVMQESGGHLTSGEVLERADARDPSIGRASVFRALDLLTALSIIRPTFLEPRTPTYVMLSQEGHHSHIICTRCSRVIELDDCSVTDLVDDLEIRYRIHVTGHLLEFYGMCDDCRGTQDT